MALNSLQGIENRILRLIASGASLDETARALCCDVEALLPGLQCIVIRADPAGLLRALAPGSRLDEPCSPPGGVMTDPDAGLSVVANDRDWTIDRGPAGLAGGNACWSTAIMGVGGEPIGVLALYFGERRGPTAREMAALAK